MADFRRWILAFAALVLVLGLVAPASAQGSLNCNASASVVPTLRHEGFTELTGDIVLTCTGAPGAVATPTGSQIAQANVSVSLSAPVTSRILGGAAPQLLTDALLLVDDPGPGNQHVCPSPTNGAGCIDFGDNGASFATSSNYNVFEGLGGSNVPGPNTVTFLGVPVDPPATAGAIRTYRITNIRVDATNVGAGGQVGALPVYAFVSVSPSSAITVNNPQLVVGLVSYGLTTKISPVGPVFFQCETTDTTNVATVSFMENFATAFKVRGATGSNVYPQNTPGVVYNSESGLEIGLPSGHEAGAADTPTELQLVISNVPVGAIISADSYAVSSAQITCTETSPVGCVNVPSDATMVSPVAGTSGGGPVVVLDNSKGTAAASVTIVWAITNTNPYAIDTLAFGVYGSFAAQTSNSTMLPPPTTGVTGFSPQAAAASSTENIPTFSSTVEANTTPSNLFSVQACQTILLFPYVTDFYGFDTGIAISNTSMDSLPSGTGAIGQTGTCSVAFYGAGGAATTLGTSGVYSSTSDTTLTSGVIAPGQTWAFSLSGIDAGYNSTPTYGTTGYAIATCQFQYAHGYSFVSDTGVRNFAAAYLALIIPDAPRAAQPFVCSVNSTTTLCNTLTGEQLVH